MNIETGETPLVLLCPAWKKWGSATTVKANTIILHSRADDVVPFEFSEELIRNSDLPDSALIETGTDHRLADPESLGMTLRACARVSLVSKLLHHATLLRNAINDAKKKCDDRGHVPYVNRWPVNCCDSPYLFDWLYLLGYRGIRRICGDTSHYGSQFQRHVWVSIDGIDIDITADQFPDVSQEVIVSPSSMWHQNLTVLTDELWAEAYDGDEEALYKRHQQDQQDFYDGSFEGMLREFGPTNELLGNRDVLGQCDTLRIGL
jgi:hypothetical protein